MHPLSRREVLRTGFACAAGVALAPLLASCSRATPSQSVPARTLKNFLKERIAAGAKPGLQAAFGAGDFVAGFDRVRVPFGLLEPGVGRVDIEAGRAQVLVQADWGGAMSGPFAAAWHPFSKPESRPSPQGFYAAEIAFDRPGIWSMLAEVEKAGRRLAGTAAFEVLAKSSTVAVGEAARPSESPTFTVHRGVDPVCTRRPMCPFHKVSLADALKAGKPVAVQLGTPLFCESRVCGPSLEELIAAVPFFPKKTVVIHVEIYRDLHKSGLVKAVEEWGLQSEPWLFSIDPRGIVRGRLEGPQTAAEIRQAVLSLRRG